MAAPPSYWEYLKLDRLLALQSGFEADESELSPDEVTFVVVHQCYELWFKLVLRELRLARDRLAAPRVPEETLPGVVHHLRRVSAILQLAVDQFRIVETLAPQDFLAFRDKLVPASGFQSFQLREIEILMGLEDAERVRYGKVDPLEHIRERRDDSPAAGFAWERIAAARAETSVLAALEEWLHRTPIQGSHAGDPGDVEVVTGFLDAYLAASDASLDGNLARLVEALGERVRPQLTERFGAMRAAARAFLFAEDVAPEHRDRLRRTRAALLFIESYRDLPLLAWPRLLLDVVVEMEEQLLLWRHRHVRMVERVIGRRVGTGGSDGVDYLEKTTSYRVFRDLWAVRTVLLPKERVPPLQDPAFYGFAAD